jgi:hypothetical protein
MSPELGAPGERLCPSCARFGPDSDPICRHCGYNFESGAPSSWSGAPILADQPESPPTPGAQPRRRVRGRFIAFVLLVAVIGAFIGPVLAVFESATELIEDFPGGIDVDVPDITIPDISTKGPEGGSFEKCKKGITGYMRQMFANDGSGNRPLNELFIEASVKLGPSSFEYRTLVKVFSDNQGVAITNGTRAGLNRAALDTERACRRQYRN